MTIKPKIKRFKPTARRGYVAELALQWNDVTVTAMATHGECKRLYTELRDILDAANDPPEAA